MNIEKARELLLADKGEILSQLEHYRDVECEGWRFVRESNDSFIVEHIESGKYFSCYSEYLGDWDGTSYEVEKEINNILTAFTS